MRLSKSLLENAFIYKVTTPEASRQVKGTDFFHKRLFLRLFFYCCKNKIILIYILI
jgi:hypothetical protein